MSMTDAYYGDYGQAEASAVRQRKLQSIAAQQAQFLGQQRGQRKIADIRQQYTEGFRPKMQEYGRRGLAGPTVSSGIQRSGLERYAQQFQRTLGEETTALQQELNMIAEQEAAAQADLEKYIADLRLQKQRDIVNAATALKQLQGYQ